MTNNEYDKGHLVPKASFEDDKEKQEQETKKKNKKLFSWLS